MGRAPAGKGFLATTSFALLLSLMPAPLRAELIGAVNEVRLRGCEQRPGAPPLRAAQRATRAGYRWRAIGENIAAGPPTAEIVVTGWVESPEHCANLMNPRYTEMGIAYAVNPPSKHGIYWVQMFGAPR